MIFYHLIRLLQSILSIFVVLHAPVHLQMAFDMSDSEAFDIHQLEDKFRCRSVLASKPFHSYYKALM